MKKNNIPGAVFLNGLKRWNIMHKWKFGPCWERDNLRRN